MLEALETKHKRECEENDEKGKLKNFFENNASSISTFLFPYRIEKKNQVVAG
jgi:hypothetical protein